MDRVDIFENRFLKGNASDSKLLLFFRMGRKQSVKPYLKCGLKFDWHVQPSESCSLILNSLAKFLAQNGFRRATKSAVKRKLETAEGDSATGMVKSVDVAKPTEVEDADKTGETSPLLSLEKVANNLRILFSWLSVLRSSPCRRS